MFLKKNWINKYWVFQHFKGSCPYLLQITDVGDPKYCFRPLILHYLRGNMCRHVWQAWSPNPIGFSCWTAVLLLVVVCSPVASSAGMDQGVFTASANGKLALHLASPFSQIHGVKWILLLVWSKCAVVCQLRVNQTEEDLTDKANCIWKVSNVELSLEEHEVSPGVPVPLSLYSSWAFPAESDWTQHRQKQLRYTAVTVCFKSATLARSLREPSSLQRKRLKIQF